MHVTLLLGFNGACTAPSVHCHPFDQRVKNKSTELLLEILHRLHAPSPALQLLVRREAVPNDRSRGKMDIEQESTTIVGRKRQLEVDSSPRDLDSEDQR